MIQIHDSIAGTYIILHDDNPAVISDIDFETGKG
jgi:hypothetical protein